MKNQNHACLLIDKPTGITSSQAVLHIKKKLNVPKVGHSGTLDRFARGLLLVFIGQATRLSRFFVGLDKRYEAVVRFGSETSTLGPEGEILAQAPLPALDDIKRALIFLEKAEDQVPPCFSALHYQGERAYKRCLRGEVLELPARQVRLFSTEILAWDGRDLHLRLHCSSGYYVRSLARDLGRLCSSRAHLYALKRQAIASFSCSEATELDKVEKENLCSSLSFLEKLACVVHHPVEKDALSLLRQGIIPKDFNTLQQKNGFHALRYQNALLAVLEAREGHLNFLCNFSNYYCSEVQTI